MREEPIYCGLSPVIEDVFYDALAMVRIIKVNTAGIVRPETRSYLLREFCLHSEMVAWNEPPAPPKVCTEV